MPRRADDHGTRRAGSSIGRDHAAGAVQGKLCARHGDEPPVVRQPGELARSLLGAQPVPVAAQRSASTGIATCGSTVSGASAGVSDGLCKSCLSLGLWPQEGAL